VELLSAVRVSNPVEDKKHVGLIVEFYKVYWEVIGSDFHEMIQEAVRLGRLPTGVTKGLISLLHKDRGRVN
jgi:hypothetical protein